MVLLCCAIPQDLHVLSHPQWPSISTVQELGWSLDATSNPLLQMELAFGSKVHQIELWTLSMTGGVGAGKRLVKDDAAV